MQKSNRSDNQRLFLRIWGGTMLVLTLILVSLRLSAAPGDNQKIREGLRSPDQIEASTGLIRAKSSTIRTTGWIGNKRVDLRTSQSNRSTRVTGWVGNEYINVKEHKDD